MFHRFFQNEIYPVSKCDKISQFFMKEFTPFRETISQVYWLNLQRHPGHIANQQHFRQFHKQES